MTTDIRRTKGLVTRDRILEAALSIIAKEGLKGLSAQKVSEICQISKSTLFHHFKTMDQIPLELFRLMEGALIKGMAYAPEMDVITYLLALGERTFLASENELLHYKALQAFYIEAVLDPKYADVLRALKDRGADVLAKGIQTLCGYVEAPLSLRELCEGIIYCLDGYGLHFLLERDSEKFLKLWSQYCQCIHSQVLTLETCKPLKE